ncbi:MAG: hypothetical protein FJ403_06530 [Verrucomicrobia bacterium]|nr:hypothetical protein [Verrucomicrobiota bacterium]
MGTVSDTWKAVRAAAEQHRRDQTERSENLVQESIRWFDRVKEFRAAADESMVLQTPSDEDRRIHRAYLVQVIATGEELAMLARVQEIGPNTQGITIEAIEAELELLHASLAGEHYLSSDQRQTILNRVFGHGAKSEA